MEATHASKEAVWLQRLCSGIGLVQKAVRIDCDNESEIFLMKNLNCHSKKNHIHIQYHFVRSMV
jgi:phosphoribosyl-AMP cyclohydrolase